MNPLAGLERDALRALLEQLSPQDASAALHHWDWWARPEQLPPPGDWDIWLLLAGRGCGKTRVGAETVRGWVQDFRYVNLVGINPADVRDVMIEGESGILACCGPWERPVWKPSRRRLDWPNGAQSLIFSAEDPDQLRGPQSEKMWFDELAAWTYPQETWDMAMMGLRLGPKPQAVVTTTPKPIPLLRALVERPNVVVVKGKTDDNIANLSPAFIRSIVEPYRGTRLGRQELDAELLLDEGLAYRVADGVHLVPFLRPPDTWERFEALDFGSNAPTAWLAFAVDYDGHVLVYDAYYQPGLVSEHAYEVRRRREQLWLSRDGQGKVRPAPCYAPPDVHQSFPKLDARGKEWTIETEFADHGIGFAMAQTDRRAGYMRVAEMLTQREWRRFPGWHPRYGELGSPSLFICDTENLAPLVKQLRDAPLEDPDSPVSRWPGEAVGGAWEHAHGHAHAALRYGLMSRPLPSEHPLDKPLPNRDALIERYERRLREQTSVWQRDDDLVEV